MISLEWDEDGTGGGWGAFTGHDTRRHAAHRKDPTRTLQQRAQHLTTPTFL
jgi:hypothetical protein